MAEPSAASLAFKPDPGASYKLIYLAQRNPALQADDFPQAWREHSQLASKFAGSLGSHFRSVRQCVKDRAAGLADTFSNDRDGSAILAMKSWNDLMSARYHPRALDEMLADEARVFSSQVDNWTMAVAETVLQDGETGEHMILSFLARRPACGPAHFSERSLARTREFARGGSCEARIVWNEVIDPARDLKFDGVIELWYPNRTTALSAAADPKTIEVLEQSDIADPTAGARLFARLNLAKQTSGEAEATAWEYDR